MKPVTFSLGSIVWREYTFPFVQSLYRLVQLRPDVDMLMLAGDALVSRARGIIATGFLHKRDTDVLLFVDSDIFFDPHDAVTVCEQAHAIGGIVGAAYTVRRANGSFPACMLKDGEPVTFYDPNGPDLVDVEYPSGGYVAIDRSVLEGVVARLVPATLDRQTGEIGRKPLHAGTNLEHYPIFQPFEKDGLYLSEDWSFAELARRAGFPIKLNPKVRLRHIGQYGHHMEDMLTDFQENRIVRVTKQGDDYTAELVA